jgi:hypothetical protein
MGTRKTLEGSTPQPLADILLAWGHRCTQLSIRVDFHYSQGNFQQAEDLDAELEELLDNAEGLSATQEVSAEEIEGALDTDNCEYDSASPCVEAELVNLLYRWRTDSAWSEANTFGTFVRQVLGYRMRNTVTDAQIEEAAFEALEDYQRRFHNFKRKQVV